MKLLTEITLAMKLLTVISKISKSHSAFSRYIKDEFLSSYNSVCTTPGCYSCEG